MIPKVKSFAHILTAGIPFGVETSVNLSLGHNGLAIGTNSSEPTEELGQSNVAAAMRMMEVKCAHCGRLFDSNFTTKDFQRLSTEQLDSGLLQLCIHCGHLGLYRLRDYTEG